MLEAQVKGLEASMEASATWLEEKAEYEAEKERMRAHEAALGEILGAKELA